MAQFDLKKATIKLKDGAAHELEIKVHDGTLSWTEKKNMVYTKDRGILSSVKEGDQEPLDVKIDITWEFLKTGSGEAVSPEDFLKQRGGASAYTSSDTDVCAPYAVDIEIVYDPDCGAIQIETITLPDFRQENVDHDAKTGVLSISGKCNVTQATVARS